MMRKKSHQRTMKWNYSLNCLSVAWHLSVSSNRWGTKWAVAIQRVVALCVLLLPSGRKKKKESNHIPWQDIKKKLKDITNSLSEGSLRIVNERTNEQFSGGKKEEIIFVTLKWPLRLRTTITITLSVCCVYLRRKKLYQFLIFLIAIYNEMHSYSSQCWDWYTVLNSRQKSCYFVNLPCRDATGVIDRPSLKKT